MITPLSRRALLVGSAIASISIPTATARAQVDVPSLPIGWSDMPPGTGFEIRHGFQTENSWYLPGYWHCGEDWYAIDRDSSGANVYALTAGEVVYVGSDYPGRVVILHHADDLYSMYGHLDYEVSITEGDQVSAGSILGTVLLRTDGAAPSHLHYETRTFLTTPDVNGVNPRYDFSCGPNCPPGPGYWPMDAPELPVDLGWRNPIHTYGGMLESAFLTGIAFDIVTSNRSAEIEIWSSDLTMDRVIVGRLETDSNERFELLEISYGELAEPETSAKASHLWYRIDPGWIRAFQPSAAETGSDGQPSKLDLMAIAELAGG